MVSIITWLISVICWVFIALFGIRAVVAYSHLVPDRFARPTKRLTGSRFVQISDQYAMAILSPIRGTIPEKVPIDLSPLAGIAICLLIFALRGFIGVAVFVILIIAGILLVARGFVSLLGVNRDDPAVRTIYRLTDPVVKRSKPVPVGSGVDFLDHFRAVYSDIEKRAEGGKAWVYAAKRKSDGQQVALKVVKEWNMEMSTSFMDEASIWKNLEHPNIVRVNNYAAYPRGYLELEFLPGSLEKISKPVEPRKAAYLIFRIAEGLKFAHTRENPILHLDIKPGNILLSEGEQPKLSDWGMARILSVSRGMEAKTEGFTTLYAAPEQIRNENADVRTDVFQLGHVFYELAAGKPPFEAATEPEIRRKIEEEPPPRLEKPPVETLEGIIFKCLEKEKERRYHSMEELQKDLAGIIGIKLEEKVKVTQSRLEKITASCELVDVHAHLGNGGECIKWLEMLLRDLKTSEVKEMTQAEIEMLKAYVREEISIEERISSIEEILHQARTKG